MTIKHRIRRGGSRKLRGGQPFQNNPGAHYSGAGSSGSSMGPNIRALGASGGRSRRRSLSRNRSRSRKMYGGNPFQNNPGAPYAGAGSSGSSMGPNIRALGASGGRSRRRSRGRKMYGGNPFQNNPGAPYAGAGSSGSSMGPNIRALGASGGRSRRRSLSRNRSRSRGRKMYGGQPFQNNPGAAYSGAGSSGSSMGPNIRALGASGGKRRKGRRGKGGSIISAAAVPFGLLGLQKWFKGAFKQEK